MVSISLSLYKHIYQNMARHRPQLNKQNEDQCLFLRGVLSLPARKCQRWHHLFTAPITQRLRSASLQLWGKILWYGTLPSAHWCVVFLCFFGFFCHGTNRHLEIVQGLVNFPSRQSLESSPICRLGCQLSEGPAKVQTGPCQFLFHAGKFVSIIASGRRKAPKRKEAALSFTTVLGSWRIISWLRISLDLTWLIPTEASSISWDVLSPGKTLWPIGFVRMLFPTVLNTLSLLLLSPWILIFWLPAPLDRRS